jgi:predicted nucleotide-binding protein
MQQKLVQYDGSVASAFAKVLKICEVDARTTIITDGAFDDGVFLILAGSFYTVVRGRTIATRVGGEHVGEMAALNSTQARSASIIAAERSVVGRLSKTEFDLFLQEYPQALAPLARTLSARLLQRNSLLAAARERVRVFVMSSSESLDVARAFQNACSHDPFAVAIWTDGTFRLSSYALEDLENELDVSDIAIAIAAADDHTISRGTRWPAPRDNVTFELGFFMGRLGRERTFLLEPRGEHVKLPSDLDGLTTVDYVWKPGPDQISDFAPTANQLRDIIRKLGQRP